jgi:hypothetical protein
MLVMDLSCSMMVGDHAMPDSPMTMSRGAARAFVDRLAATDAPANRVGVALYADYAVREPDEAHPDGTRVTARQPDPLADPPWLPLTPVDDDLVDERIGGVCETSVPLACGVPHPSSATIGSRTNPGPALEQAVNELVASTEAAPDAFPAILFFTDGWPTSGGGPEAVEAAVDRAWDHGISVFPVLFANGGGDIPWTFDLTRGVPVAFAQVTKNHHDLPARFEAVARAVLAAPSE